MNDECTFSLGPNPDDTSTILALLLSLGGVSFSLSSCPSDGELFFNVLAAELELGVLEAPAPFTHGPVCERKQTNKKKESATGRLNLVLKTSKNN